MNSFKKSNRDYALVFCIDLNGNKIGTIINLHNNQPLLWAHCEKLIVFCADRRAFGFEKGEVSRLAQEFLNQSVNQSNTD